MQAEIITVGTEILLGQIDNTNATYLARQLAQLGIEVHYQTTVGDHPGRIGAAVETACDRNDLVLVCGGLGPTADDQTKAAVAAALGTSLTLDTAQMTKITDYFTSQNRQMVATNRKQALTLTGGQPLANPAGLALGDFYEAPTAAVAVLPGPPSELKAMFEQILKPLLVEHYQLTDHLQNRYLFFTGISESELMVTTEALMPHQSEITVGSYAQPHAIEVRLTASSDQPVLHATLDQLEATLIKRFEPYYLGNTPTQSVVQRVVDRLKEQGLTITAAESLTAGLFQSTLCTISGASTIFRGGFVTYANAVKAQVLGIDPAIISQHGVVSAEVAQQMAEKSRRILQTDIGVAFTGVAGPDALEDQQPGTVWLGLAQSGKPTQTRVLHLPNRGRQAIREQSVWRMFNWLFQEIK